jgi:hypothetical protein
MTTTSITPFVDLPPFFQFLFLELFECFQLLLLDLLVLLV